MSEQERKLTRDEALLWIYDRFGRRVAVCIDDWSGDDDPTRGNSYGLEYEGVLQPGAAAPSEQHPNPSQGQSDELAELGWFYVASAEILTTFMLNDSYDSDPHLTEDLPFTELHPFLDDAPFLQYRLGEKTRITIGDLDEEGWS